MPYIRGLRTHESQAVRKKTYIVLARWAGRPCSTVATCAKTRSDKSDDRRRGVAAAGEIVLVVDDDPSFRTLVRTLLERAGMRVVEAVDGDEALAALEPTAPHLVLLDVMLPRTSGYEVFRELRDRCGETLPIIFISGERVDAHDRVAGLLLGADDYIVKPFDPDELIARVRRPLGRRTNGGTHAQPVTDELIADLPAPEHED